MSIKKLSTDIVRGDLIYIGAIVYKVDYIDDDTTEQTVSLTLKPNGFTYLIDEDFMYLTLSYKHMLFVLDSGGVGRS